MRTVIAIILLILIVGVGIFEQVFIDKVMTQLKEKSEIIKSEISQDDKERALQLTEETIEWWEIKSQILETMVPHNSLKDIPIQLSTLKGQLETEDMEQALVCCYVIYGICESAPHYLGFHIEHIL